MLVFRKTQEGRPDRGHDGRATVVQNLSPRHTPKLLKQNPLPAGSSAAVLTKTDGRGMGMSLLPTFQGDGRAPL